MERNGYNDFLGISEYSLFEQDLFFLSLLSNSYSYYATSDGDLLVNSNRKVGKRGKALLWHKIFDHCVSQLPFINDRIIGIQIELTPKSFIYIFQTYLPSKNNSADFFYEHVECIQNVLFEYSWKGEVILMGEFNCHIKSNFFYKPLDSLDKKFMSFLNDNSLTGVTSLDCCGVAPVTFESSCGQSIIDNIIVHRNLLHHLDHVISSVILSMTILFFTPIIVQCNAYFILKVALQILGQNFYKNTKKTSLYSQSLLIFIHRTPVGESHPITRENRDLLWPMSTPTRNTVYFYMSSSFIYTMKLHRRGFNHSVR